jgi:tetratricopeptide (TPR) repeat protein
MSSYTVREVEALLGLPRSVITKLIDAGFVSPVRGKRREFRFSFQDLIVLRTAQGLSRAKIPPRKIARSLQRLREELPGEMPLTGLRITAVGSDVVVKEGASKRHVDSGQYLLDFEVAAVEGSVSFLGTADQSNSAEYWFNEGCAAEETDRAKARQAYEKALVQDPQHLSARLNLGYLLHGEGKLQDAERLYREALQQAPTDATLLFNLGVVLEDQTRESEAVHAYEAAIENEPDFADAHYNLARLQELLGHAREALRHYNEYRRLQS